MRQTRPSPLASHAIAPVTNGTLSTNLTIHKNCLAQPCDSAPNIPIVPIARFVSRMVLIARACRVDA